MVPQFLFPERHADSPAVTVVVPCHNYGRYVGAAIESALEQSLPASQREVIVVDDASSDDSWEVIRKYERFGVTCVRHDQNQGHIKTYHDGMARSYGAYIVLLSADDLAIDRDGLKDQVERLDTTPSAAAAFADFAVINEEGREIAMNRISAPDLYPGAEAFRRLLAQNFIQHCGTMVRRSFFEQTGGYDDRLFHSVDWELWLRVAARADLLHIGRPLYAYRVHRTNMHRSHGYDNSMNEIRKVFEIVGTYGPPETNELIPAALARHYVARAAVYLRMRRVGRALHDLRDAARRDPRSLLNIELLKGAVRAIVA